MASLNGQTIAASYEQLLHVDADGGGNGTTHVSVKDGDNGTTFGFTIATDALMMTSTNRLEFGDNASYIHQSADGVLDLVSDTEIELNATTIDINGAVDISGLTTSAGNLTLTKGNASNTLIFNANLSSAADNIAFIKGNWNDTTVSQITLFSGADTTNKDDGGMAFATASAGSVAERMRIDSAGNVGIGKSSIDMARDGRTALEIGAEGTLYSGTSSAQGGVTGLAHNYYYDSSNQGKFMRANEEAATMEIYNGGFYFYSDERTDQSADANVTVSQKMLISNDGYIIHNNPGGGKASIWRYDNDSNYQLSLTQDVSSGLVKHTFDLTNAGTAYNNNLVLDRGQVGIGVDAPSTKLHVYEDSSDYACLIQNNQGDGKVLDLFASTSDDHGADHLFIARTDAKTLFTIGNDGTVEMGTMGTNNDGIQLIAGSDGGLISISSSTETAQNRVRFYNGNGLVGTIQTNGSGTSYNESSDYRLKENEVPLSDGLERLNNLKPYKFNFKNDKDNIIDGFFAHEVQEFVPNAVCGIKDGEEMQQIDHSKLVPLLVASIQELSSKITELENKLGE